MPLKNEGHKSNIKQDKIKSLTTKATTVKTFIKASIYDANLSTTIFDTL